MNMKVEEIKTHPTFESLFTINGELLAKIEQNMRDENYDDSQPIILATWQGQDESVCIDGHTRLKAAKNIGIEEIPVFVHEFDSGDNSGDTILNSSNLFPNAFGPGFRDRTDLPRSSLRLRENHH